MSSPQEPQWPISPLDAIGASGAFQIGNEFKFGQEYTEGVIRSLFRIPVDNLEDALEILQEYLAKLPLDVLKIFKDLIPDAVESDFEDVFTAANTIITNLIANPNWDGLLNSLKMICEFLTSNTLAQCIADLADDTGDFALNFVQGLFGLIESLWQALQMNTLAQCLVDWFTDLFGSSGQFLTDFVAAVMYLLNELNGILDNPFFTAIKELVDDAGLALLNVLNGLVAGVQQLVSLFGFANPVAVLDFLQDAIDSLWRLLTGSFAGVGKTVSDIVSAATNWLSSTVLTIFSRIPLSALFEEQTNLLAFGDFDTASDVFGQEGWEWDTTDTASGGNGCAKVTLDGNNKQLFRRELIPVKAGDRVNLSAKVKTSNWTGTSYKRIALSLVNYHGDAIGNTEDVVVSSANASGWSMISGDYTVPAGVTHVAVLLQVKASSAGVIKFDDIDLHRQGLLQMDWVGGLGSTITEVNEWIQQVIDGIIEALTGIPIVGGLIEDVVTGLGDLWNDAQEALSKAGDALGDLGELLTDLLTNPTKVLGQIPQALVSGLTSILNSIGTQASNAWNTVTALAANLLAVPAAVIGNIVSVVVDGVATMGQFLTQLWEGLTGQVAPSQRLASNVKTAGGSLLAAANTAQTTANTAVGNASTAQTSANNAQSTANNAEAQAAANAAELAKINAANSANATSGAYAFDNFDYSSDPFGTTADWAVAGSGGGKLVTNGSKLSWVDSGNAVGSRLCRFLKAKTLTSYQLVTMVLDSPKIETPLGGEAFNYLVGRLNSAFTSYVYAKIGYNSISVWKVVAGVGEFQIGNSVGYVPQVGDTIQFVCGNPDTNELRQFRVRVNNSPVLTVTDGTFFGGVLSVEDAVNNTWSGTAFYAGARTGGGQNTPGSLSIFSVADNKPQPLLGSGLRASRSSGTNATVSAGDNIFPLGWFGSVDKTSDLTYDSLTGRVTVSVEGWYQVVICQDGAGNVGAGTGGQARAVLWKGSGTGDRAVEQRGAPVPWNINVGFNGIAGNFIVYLRDGEWIEPGYNSTVASNPGQFFVGSGQNTWFSVALLNRSYN